MTVWVVRAGRAGKNECFVLEKGVAAIGKEPLADLSGVESREAMYELCKETFPEEKPRTVISWAGQIWAFRTSIQLGELVMLPLQNRFEVAIGQVTRSYEYRADWPPDVRHTRRVDWIWRDVPRTAFDPDIQGSLKVRLAVYRIQRNQAEARIRAVLEGRARPEQALWIQQSLMCGDC